MLTACFSTGCIMATLSGSSLGQSAAEVIKLAVEYPQTLTMDRWQCFLPRTERKYVLSVPPPHSTCAYFVISSQTLLCVNVRVGGQCGNRSLSGHTLPCRGDALSGRGSAAGPERWVGDGWGRRTDDSGQSRGWLELSSWCQTDWHSECSCSKVNTGVSLFHSPLSSLLVVANPPCFSLTQLLILQWNWLQAWASNLYLTLTFN